MVIDAPFPVLLQHAFDGDEEAAGVLVRECERALGALVRHRLFRSGCRSFCEADDILQEAWVALLPALRMGRVEIADWNRLHALLATICVRRIAKTREFFRAQCRDARRTVRYTSERARDGRRADNPLRMTPDCLREIKSELDCAEWTVMQAYLQGRSWSEIAAPLRISPGAARKRVSRIVDRLRTALTRRRAG